MEFSTYVTGFVDGEGSFLVSFNRNGKFVTGIEVRPSFTVSQHRRNLAILKRIHEYFGCGSIRFDRHDQTYKYEVRSLDDLKKKIIPHFEKYPLQTSKVNDFKQFSAICKTMKENKHRSHAGILEIIEQAYTMNNHGARRYAKEDLLQMVRKMKV